MYNNHMTRKLDGQGRIVIPIHIRRTYDLKDSYVEIFSENDLICIRKVDTPPKPLSIFQRGKGTSGCNFCICSSCTGFGCPWVPEVYRFKWSIGLRTPERCWRCMTKKMDLIHDCDFYTRRKRTKFYVKKRWIHKMSNHDVVMRELAELKRLLTGK